nr:MAG TPA: Bradykinin [Caudoviricetes sp.]
MKAPICNVIRMGLTPFRGVWLTACRCATPKIG